MSEMTEQVAMALSLDAVEPAPPTVLSVWRVRDLPDGLGPALVIETDGPFYLRLESIAGLRALLLDWEANSAMPEVERFANIRMYRV